ncbi:iron-sulfur cluster assembly scaffold protein [Spiroplasma eriocheiris]|uniref:FeS assembly protein n=1 Tax=Spiroplasma eriocheiris TaxID=315358 RepID=A0A0H3XJF6_9MOLU|nr:iron-sulfur cluster assembly scaffold protein [Spiroplasma eriocheiris]AHF58273.1 putative iron-sulfur cluster assembly protein NifU [Spiroplasma eriocheiris CCTCC M 207170]AKM54710.1 FeS assembly protein [Spiroplasma eriocheiris]
MRMENKDPIFLRQIIMEHYANPTQKGLLKKPNSLYVHQASDSCIDDMHLELEIADNKITSAKFDRIGCAISTAATDIMAGEIVEKPVAMAIKIIDNYLNMLFERTYDETMLNELIAFINVPKQPNRIKCASIGVNGFLKLLQEYEKTQK